MANTHEVLEGVKEYTRDLIGVAFRDVAVDAAGRAETAATRAETAADNAEVGIRDDTVTKQHLAPGLRDELDGKADRTEVPTTAAQVGAATPAYVDQETAKKADTGHKHTGADITNTTNFFGSERSANRIVAAHDDGQLHSSRHPTTANHLARKSYVDEEVAKKADKDHTHTAAEVGAATPAYVDERIQLVTSWPASPVAGVLYLMEE